jgi:hypothetical protein
MGEQYNDTLKGQKLSNLILPLQIKIQIEPMTREKEHTIKFKYPSPPSPNVENLIILCNAKIKQSYSNRISMLFSIS